MNIGKRAEHDVIRTSILKADWNFWGSDTGYLTHSAHRYSGKFIPQIARQAIDMLTRPGDLIVDPYCGSGTTLVEAAMQGRRALGVDMSPLAVLISTVKVTPLSEDLLRAFVEKMQRAVQPLGAEDLFGQPASPRVEADPRLHDEWFTKWFQPAVLRDLIAIHQWILDEPDARLQRVGLVAFSDVLRRASNAHQGYPNVMFDRRGLERPRPGRQFLRTLKQLATAIMTLPSEVDWGAVKVQEGDARQLQLSDAVAQAVITHPPYVGSIPYAEYGALSLHWLGHDHKALDKRLTGGQRQSRYVLERFKSDYAAMISEAYRVTRLGGYFFALVGDPTIKGAVVDLGRMTVEHAMVAGYEEVAVTTRSAENRRANKMGDETLLTFRKS